jgi:3-hydroxyisobutyrate dehydrogenase-like beta-hydroxyacid dehydrogenase
MVRNWEPTTPVSAIVQDLLFVHEFAQGQRARVVLGGLLPELYEEALGRGHGSTDMSVLCLHLEQIAGVEIGSSDAERAAE